MLWRRASGKSKSRSVRCFYCAGDATISGSARVRDWRCRHCEALNILDEHGEIADDVPQEYQRDCSSLIATRADRPGVQQLASPFCSVCTNNHALLAKSLASYLPSDDDPDYRMYEKALPAYRASLEERFPSLCASCAPSVKVRLERNNYVAKATALGSFLSRTHGHKRTTPQRGWQAYVKSIFWAIRGTLWLVGLLVTLRFLLCSISRSLNLEAPWLQGDDVSARWLWYSIFGTFWYPAGLRALLNPELKVQGRAEYNRLQLAVQAMRFFRMFVLERLQMHDSVALKIDVLLLCLTVVHLVLSWHVITLSEPPKVTLKDSTDLSLPADSFSAYEEEDLPMTMHVSPFQDRAMMHALHSIDHDPDDNDHDKDNDTTTIDEDDMDWQPVSKQTASRPARVSSTAQLAFFRPIPLGTSPFSTMTTADELARRSPAITSPTHPARDEIPLARQKFFAPEKPTGLESLFSAAVRLDDEPLVVRSLKQVRRAGLDPWYAVLGTVVLSTALVPNTTFASGLATTIVKCILGICSHLITLHRVHLLAQLWSSIAIWTVPVLIKYAGPARLDNAGAARAMQLIDADLLLIVLAAANAALLASPLLRSTPSRNRVKADRTRLLQTGTRARPCDR